MSSMYFTDLKKLENGLKTIQKDENIKSILLFGCDKNTADDVELEKVLRLKTAIGWNFSSNHCRW